MSRKTAQDFPGEVIALYDALAHGRITEAEFLEQAELYARPGLDAAAMLAALRPDYALARQVSFTDPDIRPEYITYPSPAGHGEIRAYMVRPAADGPHPAVLVVHENRGLNPYIEDVARRLAKAGFIAMAPDGLTPAGGYPGNDDKGRELQAALDPAKLRADFCAGFEYLRGIGTRTGCIGFCYGGRICNDLAVEYPDLGASVPFYGTQPPADQVARIAAPLLLHYAEHDERVNAGWPAYEAALRAAGKEFTAHVYPGTNHGFHNDSTPRFDAAAARLAWDRTLAFLETHLR